MNAKAIASFLFRFYRTAYVAGRRELTPSQCATNRAVLREGDVLAIHKSEGVEAIEVERGCVWLTGKSGADVILKDEGRFDLENQWPYVIEALANTEISLKKIRT